MAVMAKMAALTANESNESQLKYHQRSNGIGYNGENGLKGVMATK